MTNTAINEELNSILACLRDIGQPVAIGELQDQLDVALHPKTLQRRLNRLIERGEVIASGTKKGRKYRLATMYQNFPIDTLEQCSIAETKGKQSYSKHPIFSSEALNKLTYLDTPAYTRTKRSYQRALLESYTPNKTFYLPLELRNQLHQLGKRFDRSLAAGTYAREIGQRLLIDLSYNSSRLEGNTYSKLDTQKLIEQGLSAEGKIHEETVMIVNHKEAIRFLIENAEDITLTPFTIRNIHFLLAQDLLANPQACGKEREIEVAIGRSSYLPLNNPHQIRETLALLLLKADQIDDPFEQGFFLLTHLSYLQAFEDVNKRTARLACNIPFIKHNLCPLSFTDVPQEDYFKALVLFYETNELLPAVELFVWAYSKSCEHYTVVKNALGEIDAHRIRYRSARKEAMGQIIRRGLGNEQVAAFLRDYCQAHQIEQPDKFIAMTTSDLEQLHEGGIIGLGITEAMFKNWKEKADPQKK